MTTNKRSERRHCRYWLRRVNLLLVTLALLVVVWLAQAGAVSAAPMACRFILHGQICRSSITGEPTGRCDMGYEQMADLSCKRLVARPWAPWGGQP